MIKEMEISVVIPAYNEENRIVPTIDTIKKYLNKHSKNYEIIIIDDGSKDATYSLLFNKYMKDERITVLRNEKNRGKGFSVKRGFLKAKYSLVLFTDSDLATPLEELDKMVPLIKANDIIIASRNM